MGYRIFNTEAQAKAFSHAEAVNKGRGREIDTIQYWYSWRETIDNKWAVECPEGSDNPIFPEVTP